MSALTGKTVPTGIVPLDERVGGLASGGTYLVVGEPGPAKMVAVLQFLHEGVSRGEPSLLITNAEAGAILDVARAWGFPMESAWRDGTLQVLGFREDFELRAIRSIEPEEVLEELDGLVRGEPERIAVDPGSLFLTGGAKTLLGAAFVAWARRQPATVLATFSVDGDPAFLPSAADWLVTATTGRLVVSRRPGDLFQITLSQPIPGASGREQAVSLELKAGGGLVRPTSFPERRSSTRKERTEEHPDAEVDRNRLLLVSLDTSDASDLERWARRAFQADVVVDPLEAVAKVQEGPVHGCVLVHARRARVREAVQACRALRPLTPAAIVFASDDAVRSNDRVHLLEAGADDCLTGVIDFRELGLRIKQSMASGARAPRDLYERPEPVEVTPARTDGGRVSPEVFDDEVRRRAEDPELAFFCVLEVTSSSLDDQALEAALAALVRSDEGDLVARGGDGRCLVLLQGARRSRLGTLLERIRDRLDEAALGSTTALEIGVLGHPADAVAIAGLLGTTDVVPN